MTPELQRLLDLLAQSSPQEADGLTTAEWRERVGVGEDRMRHIIKTLLAAGLMVHGRAMRPNMVGIYHAEHVYQLVSK